MTKKKSTFSLRPPKQPETLDKFLKNAPANHPVSDKNPADSSSGQKPNKYTFQGISLENIRNRNEERIIAMMSSIIPKYIHVYQFSPQDYMDIYALALNCLPPKYTRPKTVIYKKELRNADIQNVIEEAIQQVISRPKEK